MSSYGGYGPGGNDPFADVNPGFGPPQGQGYGGQGYGGPGYGDPGYGGQAGYGGAPMHRPPSEPENENRLFGMIAIGLGLLGFVLSFVQAVYILAAVLAAVGVIFAIASLVKEPTSKGFAITGIVAGGLGLAICAVQLIVHLLAR